MSMDRRTFVAGAAFVAAAPAPALADAGKTKTMYGLIGRMTARPGRRGELVAILLEGVSGMPGCLSYIVAEDPADPNLIWITEAWESKQAHAASFSLASVKAAIAKGRPLIADMAAVAETAPVGGHGLVTPAGR
jgi:quinol monooxygenase YgiN